MGSSQQPMNVVWDTGSDWLVMETMDCETCFEPTYDFSQNPDSFEVLKQFLTLTVEEIMEQHQLLGFILE